MKQRHMLTSATCRCKGGHGVAFGRREYLIAHNACARLPQAQSKQKIIDKMMAKGLTEPVTHESTFTFNFPDCEKLPRPVLPFINVSFAYSGKKEDYLYQVTCLAGSLHLCRILTLAVAIA